MAQGLQIAHNDQVVLSLDGVSVPAQVKVDSLTPAPIEPVSVTIDELLDGKHQSEYVSITGTQFKTAGTFSGENILTDCNSEIEVYTRSAATFSGETMPTGNGTFKGIASVYNTAQLLMRDPTELDMTGDICGVPSIIYLSQNFTGLTSDKQVNTIPGWYTFSQEGTVPWKGWTLSSNNFARIKYGLIKSGEEGIRKNLDLLETNSKLNHKAFGKFD
ncbi:MAG: DUF3078 domain-containing protein, partial [Nitrospirae bacterium]|nr:DUF3078 domain-containing protein [Nitrospirota bacterium]